MKKICRILTIITLVLLMFLGLSVSLDYAVLAKTNIDTEKIISLTNQKRIENGLSILKVNNLLFNSTLNKANDMFIYDYWAHFSPSGQSPWLFIKKAGYNYLYAGENLAKDFTSAEQIVEAWMNSPGHRDNILNRRYQEIGVAVVEGKLNGKQTTLVVQHLGVPQAIKKPLGF